jgi:23S rRNA (uridine2552-2'-O)-methyltransferase
MARSKSSKQWLQEHFNDHYVKLAKEGGFRSRACFKLSEIQQRDRIMRPGMLVVDLGAAPGGWSQVALSHVGQAGTVIASDILPMDSLPGVDIVTGDFADDAVLQSIFDRLAQRKADLVISDMAPNLSGLKAVDQPSAMYLAELALDMAEQVLMPGGTFLTKVFQGEGFEAYLKMLRERFERVNSRKPSASRPRSREVYLLAREFRG